MSSNKQQTKMVKTAVRQVLAKQPKPKNKVVVDVRSKKLRSSRKSVAIDRTGYSQVEQLAECICTPYGHDVYRYSSEFSSGPTAVAQPWDVLNVPFSTGSTTEGEYPTADQMFSAQFRSPLRTAVSLDFNSAVQSAQYQFYFRAGTTFTPANPTAAYDIMANVDAGVQVGQGEYLPIVYAASTSTYTPHGSTWYPGDDGETAGRFFWLDGSDVNPGSLSLNFAGISLAGNCGEFFLDLWDDGEIQVGAEQAPLVGLTTAWTVTIPITVPGYYAMRVVADQGDGIEVTSATFAANSPIFCHTCIPGLDFNASSASAIRMIAQSFQFTNKASELNRQGQVSMVQAPEGKSWTKWMVGASPYKNVSSAAGATQLAAYNGMFGFLKPTKPTDFDFRNYVQYSGNILIDAKYPLKEETAYLVFAASITNATGRDGYFTRAYAIEYETIDVWRPVEKSHVPASEYQAALLLIKEIEAFHENPLHLKEIVGKVRSVLSKGVQWVKNHPNLVKGVTGLASMLI